MVYIGFGTIHSFRHPLGILEHIPCGYGETTLSLLGRKQLAKFTEHNKMNSGKM